MTRWLAPILSFTAEDIWKEIPGTHGESVLLETWYSKLFDLHTEEAMNFEFWSLIQEARTLVSKKLEQIRSDGKIGSSLDAEVKLYCSAGIMQVLASLEDELRFVLITSYATVHPSAEAPDTCEEFSLANGEKIKITVEKSTHKKCSRCWHLREDVGTHAKHPELCGRCIDNVEGKGETRHHA
jgi:isoleucyl-tRNA synthetase